MINFEKLTEAVFNAVDEQQAIPAYSEKRIKKAIEMALKKELRKELSNEQKM
ncbi:hypothetical protein [Anaerosporobacter sp.]